MTRAQRFGVIATICATLYFLALFEVLSIPLLEQDIANQLLSVLPWWFLVTFGSYSLWSLGWGLWTFRDCPDAYTELMSEISEAKGHLRTKGVTVD